MDHIERNDIPEEAMEKLRDPELIQKQVSEGKTFQEILGYTSEKMEKFYEGAYNLFQMQEYEKASDAFIFLTTLNPYVHSYWLGLGMAEQLKDHYNSALMAYSMANLTNMENPIPHYHSAKCYLALGDKINAMIALETTLSIAAATDQHLDLVESVKAALKKLLNS